MTKLVGIAGSLRKASFNKALLAAARTVTPEGTELEILSIDDVPLYNGDVEERVGIPESVMRLRRQIREAEGIVMTTPEYNAGVPGVLKNTLDWISRPVEKESSVFSGKPLALMGATPGGSGTALSQVAWLPTLRNLRLRLWTGGGNFLLSRAGDEITDGQLSAAKTEQLTKFVEGFVRFVEAQ